MRSSASYKSYEFGSLPTGYAYTGQLSQVSEVELLHYGARFYDPCLNHFRRPTMNYKPVFVIALSLLWALAGCACGEIHTPQMIRSKVRPTETEPPPPAPTSAPIIDSEATATPTSQPVETATPSAAPEDNHGPLLGPLMLLDEFPGHAGWHLWDMGSNQVRKIDDGTGFARFYRFYSWLNGGCELMMAHADDAIMVIDTTGKDLRRIFDYDLLPSYEDEETFRYVPSPGDQQWILYYTGSGEYLDAYIGGSYEFLHLEVISRDGSQGPYRLTDTGGGEPGSLVEQWKQNCLYTGLGKWQGMGTRIVSRRKR